MPTMRDDYTLVDNLDGVEMGQDAAVIKGQHVVTNYSVGKDGTQYVASKNGKPNKIVITTMQGAIDAYNENQGTKFTMKDVKYYKKITNIIVAIVIIGCSGDKNKKISAEVKQFTSPVSIDSFLTYNQKIDTIKLNSVTINKELNLNYNSYNRYEAQLNRDVNLKDWHCGGGFSSNWS